MPLLRSELQPVPGLYYEFLFILFAVPDCR